MDEEPPFNLDEHQRLATKKKHVSRAVRTLIGMTTALAIVHPSPQQAYAVGNARYELVDSETEAHRLEVLKDEIESRHNILLDGDWTLSQLTMMSNSLNKLPESFKMSSTDKITHYEIYPDARETAGCYCWSYADAQNNPQEDRVIRLSKEFFHEQYFLDHVLAHEGAHARSILYVINDPYANEPRILTWYEDEIEQIIGSDFQIFQKTAFARLEKKYPQAVEYLEQLYSSTLTQYNSEHGPHSRFELMFSGNYETLNKVDRWQYAVSISYGAPVEFIAVLSEWYILGRDGFMERCNEVIDDQTAERLYRFLHDKFFEGYEYDSNGNLISLPTIPPLNVVLKHGPR